MGKQLKTELRIGYDVLRRHMWPHDTVCSNCLDAYADVMAKVRMEKKRTGKVPQRITITVTAEYEDENRQKQ